MGLSLLEIEIGTSKGQVTVYCVLINTSLSMRM